jgi:TPR repeat protein
MACLKRAAYRGSSAAADALGEIYSGGLGISANPELAYAWSEVGAVEGNSGAELRRSELLDELTASQWRTALLKADTILMAVKLPDWNTGPIRGSQKKSSHPGEAVQRFIHQKLTTCPPWRRPS